MSILRSSNSSGGGGSGTTTKVPSLAIAAVVVMVINDHVLKHAAPGFITGKLSDIAGMIFFPVLLNAIVWMLLTSFAPRVAAADSSRHRNRLLLACCALTAIVFTLTKTTVFANEAYRFAWGAMQWPLQAARALMHGAPVPTKLARVVLVRDPSDVLAVPFVLLAYLAAATAGARPSRGASRARTSRRDFDLRVPGS